MASPLGPESGWWPGLALWDLAEAGPGQGTSGARTLGQGVRGTGGAAGGSGGPQSQMQLFVLSWDLQEPRGLPELFPLSPGFQQGMK